MTEEYATDECATSCDVVTTTQMDDAQTTGTNTLTSSSSSSRSLEFYFEVAVVLIGVVGTAANTLILYAMVASKQHSKHLLVFNQNALDLYSCPSLSLSLAYSV